VISYVPGGKYFVFGMRELPFLKGGGETEGEADPHEGGTESEEKQDGRSGITVLFGWFDEDNDGFPDVVTLDEGGEISGIGITLSPRPPVFPPKPEVHGRLVFDFNTTTPGNDAQTEVSGIGASREVKVALYAEGIPPITGYSLSVAFWPTDLEFVNVRDSAEGEPNILASDGRQILSLSRVVEGRNQRVVEFGATVAGRPSREVAARVGNGLLGVFTFQTTATFSVSKVTEVVVVEARFNGPEGLVPVRLRAVAVINPVKTALIGDFDNNGKVDFQDFLLFSGAFAQDPPDLRFDIGGPGGTPDGLVNFDDFFIFAKHFGEASGAGKVAILPYLSEGRGLMMAEVDGDGVVTLDVGLEGSQDVTGYGFQVEYDPSQVSFVEAQSVKSGSPLFLVSAKVPGTVNVARGSLTDAEGTLVRLRFRTVGTFDQTVFRMSEGIVLDATGQFFLLGMMPEVAVRSIPERYSLAQNTPNPFNPETSIAYDLSTDGRVRLTVYGIGGQLVRTLVDADQPAGRYTVRWDGKDDAGHPVASGVYFYRVESVPGRTGAGSFSAVKRMMLIK
jgi:hypothetical protein